MIAWHRWCTKGIRRTAALALALAVASGLPGQEPVAPTVRVPAASGVRVMALAHGLERPWGMAWLPAGGLLITEKAGQLRRWENGQLQTVPLEGLPTLFRDGQGGLLDVALHPLFAQNGWIYFSAGTGTGSANRTEVLRGVWRDGRVVEVQSLYRVPHDKVGGQHFGSRLLWLPDGTLLVSVGDGGNVPLARDGVLMRDHAQRLDFGWGKVLRLREDGRPAPDNPWPRQPGALPELWTIGHRNIQGLALDPATGAVYASEHGSRGGDEVNRLQAGGNFGWPQATHSREYWGPRISPHESLPGMLDPLVVWTPSTAPSGLSVYRGDVFPEWRGDILSGGLLSRDVRRIRLDDAGRVVGQETIRIGARVRQVQVGPDGFVYVLTDEAHGRLLRIEPTGGS